MAKVRIAVNGLGRIGRCVVRALSEYPRDDVELVALNGPAPVATHLQLLKYDSVHGRFPGDIRAEGENLVIHGREIPVYHEREPEKLPWKSLKVDVVLECTGKFNTRADSARHLAAGAKRVLVSAPVADADATLVHGVNNAALKEEHTVISVGSCTTNCLAPVADVLHKAVGIEHGFMTTIHAYTGDQNHVDGSHKDLRRARACAVSMVPTSTGAAKAIGLVLPELKGRLDGVAVRVPVPNVSMVDLTFRAARDTTNEEIHAAIRDAVAGSHKAVLDATDEPLVSIDFNHHPASSIFDYSQTFVVDGRMVRVCSWYDNEWGFSCRMLDVAATL